MITWDVNKNGSLKIPSYSYMIIVFLCVSHVYCLHNSSEEKTQEKWRIVFKVSDLETLWSFWWYKMNRDKEKKIRQPNPLSNASFVSKWLFWWVNSLQIDKTECKIRNCHLSINTFFWTTDDLWEKNSSRWDRRNHSLLTKSG